MVSTAEWTTSSPHQHQTCAHVGNNAKLWWATGQEIWEATCIPIRQFTCCTTAHYRASKTRVRPSLAHHARTAAEAGCCPCPAPAYLAEVCARCFIVPLEGMPGSCLGEGSWSKASQSECRRPRRKGRAASARGAPALTRPALGSQRRHVELFCRPYQLSCLFRVSPSPFPWCSKGAAEALGKGVRSASTAVLPSASPLSLAWGWRAHRKEVALGVVLSVCPSRKTPAWAM